VRLVLFIFGAMAEEDLASAGEYTGAVAAIGVGLGTQGQEGE